MLTTITWADTDQVTSAKLNQIVSGLSFETGDLTGTTLLVVGGKLKVGTITSSEMGANSVTSSAIANQAVETSNIAPGAVTAAKIASATITADKITSATLTFSLLSADALATQSVMENETSGYIVTPNRVKHAPGAAKAHGEFAITGTGRTIKSNSVNIASLTRVSATQTTVTLTTNMGSANYTVITSGVTDGTEVIDSCVYDKAAGSFKIRHSTEGAGRSIAFVVYGPYA